MKSKSIKLLHQQDLNELNALLVKEIQNLKKLQLDLATNKLKDTSQVKKSRRQIAILKTIILAKSQSSSGQH
jgi:ribosomal protein L29